MQVVLSHTPYRELAKSLGDKPVVISGRGASEVAAAYGFKRAVTTAQLSAKYPTAVPFCYEPGMGSHATCNLLGLDAAKQLFLTIAKLCPHVVTRHLGSTSIASRVQADTYSAALMTSTSHLRFAHKSSSVLTAARIHRRLASMSMSVIIQSSSCQDISQDSIS